jgi:hypothetical protein
MAGVDDVNCGGQKTSERKVKARSDRTRSCLSPDRGGRDGLRTLMVC